ncbi:MFS transporter [Paenarthrobacter ureafaciens]|uniref:MFS transporter n=1 Tax=Paenarthrobacter ureafaciens TaxID=37931 RepID=UPI002DB972AD|nr:MFS transporter [Paenarthrobacter ureafaciens]MEC3853673.1 MFS transporter [Paenarthrobacter ureafaciens]
MTETSATLTTEPATKRRWIVLVVISLAQLMVVFDASIMNVSLPQAQQDLGFSDDGRQWVITSYSLTFGALLLLGGRLSDRWGHGRAFTIGLLGFGAASVLGGLAPTIEFLIAARVVQGACAAILAPAALTLLSVTFAKGRERTRAVGVFSAVAGAGGGIGMLLGGSLTEFTSWRWTLLVNAFFAAAALAGRIIYIKEARAQAQADRLDLSGLLMVSAGLASLVFGFSRAETMGWRHVSTVSSIVAALVLLTTFAIIESRVSSPLLPLHVLLNRNRGSAYLSGALASAVLFTQFLLLSYYLQSILGFTPLWCGIAFLPVVLCLILGSSFAGPRLMRRIPTQMLMGTGYLVSGAGLLWLTGITTENTYPTVVLPASLLIGLGTGTAFTCSIVLATDGVQPKDLGIASAVVNTSQQVGGAVGTALLSSVAAGAAATAAQGQASSAAAVAGYVLAFQWASGFMVLAAIISFALMRRQSGEAE